MFLQPLLLFMLLFVCPLTLWGQSSRPAKPDSVAAYQALTKAIQAKHSHQLDSSRYYYLQAAEGYRQYGLSLHARKKADLRLRMLDKSFDCLFRGNEGWVQLGKIEEALTFDRQVIDSAYRTTSQLLHHCPVDLSATKPSYFLYKGNLSMRSGQYDSAQHYLQQALNGFIIRSGELNEDAGSALNSLGNLSYMQGNFKQALAYYLRYKTTYEHIYGSNSKYLASAYHNIGNIYGNRGEYDQAIAYHQKAMHLYKDRYGKHSIKVASSLMALGLDFTSKGDYDEALELYHRSHDIYLALGMEKHLDMTMLYYNMATTLSSKGELDKAMAYYYESKHLSEELLGENHPEIAAVYVGISNTYYRKDELTDCIRVMEQYLEKVANQLDPNHPDLAVAHLNLSTAYSDVDSHNDAHEHAHRALAIRLASFDESSHHVADCYLNLGGILSRKNQLDSASYYLQKGLGAYYQSKNVKNASIAGALAEISTFYRKQGDIKAAIDSAAKGLAICSPGYLTLDSTQAVQIVYFEKLYKLLTVQQTNYLFSGQVANLTACLHLAYVADRVIDSLRKVYTYDSDKITLGKFAHMAYTNAIIAAYQLNTPESPAIAYYYIEKAKAAVLFQNMNESKALKLANLPDSLAAADKTYKINIAFYQKGIEDQMAACPDCDSVLIARFTHEKFMQQRQYEAFKQRLEHDYPDFFALKYQSRIATLAEVRQSYLKQHPNRVVLAYSLADSGLAAILISRDTVLFQMQPIQASLFKNTNALQASIARMARAVANPFLTIQPVDDFRKPASELYQWLIAPFEHAIQGKELIIIPDGELYKVPFEALVKPKKAINGPQNADSNRPATAQEWAKLPYLVHEHNVAYHYSITLLLDTWKRMGKDTASAKGLLALAPVFDQDMTPKNDSLLQAQDLAVNAFYRKQPDPSTWGAVLAAPTALSPLPGSAYEIEALAAQLKTHQLPVHLLKRQQATKSNFLSQDLKQYRYIHIASHAVTDEDQPDRSAVFFAPTDQQQHQAPIMQPITTDSTRSAAMHLVAQNAENQLSGPEMYQLALNADLVTLSACQTGQGKLRPGEGIIGLTRGLLYAGARSLLVSQWKVNDASTAKLMEHFYGQQLANSSKAPSLRQAKLHLIRHSPYACPYYWAPFILIGP
jgi:CHAT domain-containing protein